MPRSSSIDLPSLLGKGANAYSAILGQPSQVNSSSTYSTYTFKAPAKDIVEIVLAVNLNISPATTSTAIGFAPSYKGHWQNALSLIGINPKGLQLVDFTSRPGKSIVVAKVLDTSHAYRIDGFGTKHILWNESPTGKNPRLTVVSGLDITDPQNLKYTPTESGVKAQDPVASIARPGAKAPAELTAARASRVVNPRSTLVYFEGKVSATDSGWLIGEGDDGAVVTNLYPNSSDHSYDLWIKLRENCPIQIEYGGGTIAIDQDGNLTAPGDSSFSPVKVALVKNAPTAIQISRKGAQNFILVNGRAVTSYNSRWYAPTQAKVTKSGEGECEVQEIRWRTPDIKQNYPRAGGLATKVGQLRVNMSYEAVGKVLGVRPILSESGTYKSGPWKAYTYNLSGLGSLRAAFVNNRCYGYQVFFKPALTSTEVKRALGLKLVGGDWDVVPTYFGKQIERENYLRKFSATGTLVGGGKVIYSLDTGNFDVEWIKESTLR
ncbi:hypothetical protein BH11ARM1_BH11ARM1_06550 [soil metagenome]